MNLDVSWNLVHRWRKAPVFQRGNANSGAAVGMGRRFPRHEEKSGGAPRPAGEAQGRLHHAGGEAAPALGGGR